MGRSVVIFTYFVFYLCLFGNDALAKPCRPHNLSGLIGYWPLDGDTIDKSGNKNNGKWIGKKLYSNGVFGQCGNFNGNNYVIVPHSSSINVGKDALTYGAWVNSKGHIANQHFLNKRCGGKGMFWDMYLSGTCENINAEIANSSYENPQVKISLSKWHHIMFTRDTSGLSTIYVDGMPINPQKIPGDSSNTHDFVIGNLRGSFMQGFKGLIDEVSIYNRALSPKEIKLLYRDGLSYLKKNNNVQQQDNLGIDQKVDKLDELLSQINFTTNIRNLTNRRKDYHYSNGKLDINYPNVILISLDTCRADALSIYGNQRKTSPNIEALSHLPETVVFKNAFSQASWTLPSHFSIFTSKYPSQHKMDKMETDRLLNSGDNNELIDRHSMLNAKTRTFVESLPECFLRLAVTGNAWVTEKEGFKGFDYFADVRQYEYFRKALHSSKKLPPMKNGHIEDIDKILSMTMDLLEATNLYEPLFLFFHTYEPHEPYTHRDTFPSNHPSRKKPDISTASFENIDELRLAYESDIFVTDEFLGYFFEFLKQRNLFDSSIIIVLSDHGEGFYERDGVSCGLTHCFLLEDELTKVPLIIKLPRNDVRKINKKEIENIVSLIDVAPTILDLLNVPIPQDYQGQSLVPLIKGTQEKLKGFSIAEDHIIAHSVSIRNEFYRYTLYFPFPFANDQGKIREQIKKTGALFFDGHVNYILEHFDTSKIIEHLFDLRTDPLQRNNISKTNPDVSRYLRTLLKTELNLTFDESFLDQKPSTNGAEVIASRPSVSDALAREDAENSKDENIHILKKDRPENISPSEKLDRDKLLLEKFKSLGYVQ